jgi:expansin
MKYVLVVAASLLVACGATIADWMPDEEADPLSDPTATGGAASGGATGTAGTKKTGSGGATGTAGAKAGTGGAKPATGGGTASGGSPGAGGSPGTGGSPGIGGTPSLCTNPPAAVQGHATWYSTTGPNGACAIPYASVKYYGAMNEEDFRASAACGACVNVTYGSKTLDIEIIDLCPYQGNEQWCGPGGHHIDLSPDAFAYFRDPSTGVLNVITWKYVKCTITGGLTYTWKSDSSQYWAELLIGNYPYEITKVEYDQGGGSFAPLARTAYGYYQASGGMGPGPYTIRITDINGSVVTDTNVPLNPGGSFQGPDNFGLCK